MTAMDVSDAMEWLLRDGQELTELLVTLDWWPTEAKADTLVVPPETSTTSPPVKNRSRQRRQEELALLRKNAAELTAELERRQSHSAGGLQSLTPTINVEPMWERLASHQLQARMQAETTNAELKRLLVSQHAVANALKCMFEQIHQVQESQTLYPPAQIMTMIRDRMSRSEQVNHLDRLGSDWRAAFALSNKFHDKTNIEFYDFAIVSTSDSELVLRVCACFAVPFASSHVDNALWTFLNQASAKDDEDVRVIDKEQTGGRLFGEFVSNFSHEGKPGRMDGAFAAQRVLSTGSESVVVSHTYFEGEGFVEGLSGHEDSWMRLTTVNMGTASPATVGHYVRDVKLRLPMEKKENHLQLVTSLAQLLEVQIGDEVAWAMQSLENMLF